MSIIAGQWPLLGKKEAESGEPDVTAAAGDPETGSGGTDQLPNSSSGASPGVPSILAGNMAVMWTQAILRFLNSDSPVGLWSIILPETSADVPVVWLGSILVGLVFSSAAYLLLCKKRRFGSLKAWIAVLLVSAVLRYL
jgi:hypothetical protein